MELLVYCYVTGCWVSLSAVVLVELFGVQELGKVLGQILTALAVALLFASPLAGKIFILLLLGLQMYVLVISDPCW